MSAIIAEIRTFFADEEFLEVETPVLQPLYGGATARPFTTHHNALDELAEIAPECTIVRDKRYVDNGAVITSAGITAGIDTALYVVQRLLGPEIAHETASHMEYHWQPEQ